MNKLLSYFSAQIISFVEVVCLFLLPFVAAFIYLKACNKDIPRLDSIYPDISTLSDIKKIGIEPVVTIKPKESIYGRRTTNIADLSANGSKYVASNATSNSFALDSIIPDNSINSVYISTFGTTSVYGSEFRIDPFCSRRSCSWSDESGNIRYRRYNFSFAPGVEILLPKGMGVDTRFFRVGDFSSLIGAQYFTKTKEVQPAIGIGYNLRRIKIVSDCDLFITYTPKTWSGGLRFELGEY